MGVLTLSRVSRMLNALSPKTLLVAISLAASVGSGCVGESTPEHATTKLPKWDGSLKLLYNNEIDPAAVGLSPAKSPRADKTIWSRATTADLIGRVRVQTVTVDRRMGVETYHLGVQFANPVLWGQPPASQVELEIRPGDPAYGLARALDSSLKGRLFVAFVKGFTGNDDETEFHFYLAPDSGEVARVVQEALALEEVGRR
jgi:hypothetical protein